MQQTVEHTSEQLAIRRIQVNLFHGGSGRPSLARASMGLFAQNVRPALEAVAAVAA